MRHVRHGLFPCYVSRQEGFFWGGKVELDAHFEIVQAPSKSEFTRVVEAQLKRLPSVVYAGEAELEAKGFEEAVGFQNVHGQFFNEEIYFTRLARNFELSPS